MRFSAPATLTYPFYLLHQRIGYTLIRYGHQLTDLPVWSLISLTVLIMLGAAWLVHRLIERPASPRLRAALRRGIAAGSRRTAGNADARRTWAARRGHGDDTAGTTGPATQVSVLHGLSDPYTNHESLRASSTARRRRVDGLGHQGAPTPAGRPGGRTRSPHRTRSRRDR